MCELCMCLCVHMSMNVCEKVVNNIECSWILCRYEVDGHLGKLHHWAWSLQEVAWFQ